MTQPIKTVMVGCGSMSAAWLKAAKEIADVQVVGLVDLNVTAARQRAEEFGLTDAVISKSLGAVLRRTAPSVVFDCTVPAAHTRVTLTALRAGCHVLGEKPMADSVAKARQMVAAAQAAGRLYAVTQNYRYAAEIRRFQAFLASGQIGGLTTLNADFFIGAHFGGFRDAMEHPLLLDMAIHTFDMARFLSGADPVAVYCREWNPAGSWYAHGAAAAAIFEMSNGLVFNYRGCWCAEGFNTPWNCEWRVLGEKGSAKWDGGANFQAQAVAAPGGFLSQMRDLALPASAPAAKIGGHLAILREFVRCLQTGGVPETIATDNIKSLAMVFAAVQSARTGKRVEIKL